MYKQSKYNMFVPLKAGKGTLVFNAVSRALAIWDDETFGVYNNLSQMDENSETAKNLKSLMYIVKEDCDETNEVHKSFEALRTYKGVAGFTVAPTMACNFACDYCFQGDHKAKSGAMSSEVCDKLADYVQKLAGDGKTRSLGITWYGGEPLLAKETVYGLSERFIEICEKANVGYSSMMVTNGYYLTEETAKRLIDCKINKVQVTLDGGREQHDSRRVLHGGKPTFDVIINNLVSAVETGLSLIIRVNIDKRNADSIEELLECLSEKGLSNRKNFGVYFAPVHTCTKECLRVSDSVMDTDDYAELEAKLIWSAVRKGLMTAPYPRWMRGSCAAIKPNGFVFLPNGDIHKCWNSVTDPALKVGTLDKIDEVTDNTLYQKWVSWTPLNLPECRDCILLPNCSGACPDAAMKREESPCISMKHNIKLSLILRAAEKGFISPDEAGVAE